MCLQVKTWFTCTEMEARSCHDLCNLTTSCFSHKLHIFHGTLSRQALAASLISTPTCPFPASNPKFPVEALVQTAVQFADANCAIFEPELGEHKLVCAVQSGRLETSQVSEEIHRFVARLDEVHPVA